MGVPWHALLSRYSGSVVQEACQLNQQARYHEGQDLRQKPYSLFRVRVDAHSVLLR